METFRHAGYYTVLFFLTAIILVKEINLAVLTILYFLGLISTTLIDIDHFILEFFKTDNFSKFATALKNPIKTFFDPEYIGLHTTEEERMRVHLLIFSTILALSTPYFILGSNSFVKQVLITVILSIGLHIGLDIYSDRNDLESYKEYFK